MTEPTGDNYGLVMPFVSVQSVGGPHDDESYVAGWRMGSLDVTLERDKPIGGVLHVQYSMPVEEASREQADLIAMKHGYRAEFGEPSDEFPGWLQVTFTKVDSGDQS